MREKLYNINFEEITQGKINLKIPKFHLKVDSFWGYTIKMYKKINIFRMTINTVRDIESTFKYRITNIILPCNSWLKLHKIMIVPFAVSAMK